MGENVRVVVRCRPLSKKETESGCKEIVNINGCSVMIQNPSDPLAPTKVFTYDNAYDRNSHSEFLYNDICYALVENVLEGYNGTIFAYGQTGCGKTHTMQGPYALDQISNERGIISRSFDHIFEAISVSSDVQYLVLVSYLEIYNENIRDLLASNENLNLNHQLKDVPGEGVTVPSLSIHTVHNAFECEELFKLGSRNRMVGATLMNVSSSRSHSIFTISLEQIEVNATHGHISPGIRKGKLNLVDLAGSERQNKTGAVGNRLKEATKINLSLSALGNVISALVDGKTKHIPYRDSKLTRLLQDSLGGNTKTLMIACISPADCNYDDTLSTLRYASRAKNISNKPIINEDPKDTMLREYREEILKLKQMLQSNQKSPVYISKNNAWLQEEKTMLQQEFEVETNRFKEEYLAQQEEKEELVRDIEKLKAQYDNQLKQSSVNDHTQLNVQNRIEIIKNALVGGERANDVQLKEKRQKKKIAAQRRLSALSHILSRVEQSEDRNLLQVHYSSIQQELNVKNEYMKSCRQKIRALEREISDLHSEFQLDRADYLETIRKSDRNLKFYQQLFDMTLPILRKDGKYWDPDEIMSMSSWNDDLKSWKLPESSMKSLKLPLTASASSAPSQQSSPLLLTETSGDGCRDAIKDIQEADVTMDNLDIGSNYFGSRKNTDLAIPRNGFNKWRDSTSYSRQLQRSEYSPISSGQHRQINSTWLSFSSTANNNNSVLSSWLSNNHRSMSKTWCGLMSRAPLANTIHRSSPKMVVFGDDLSNSRQSSQQTPSASSPSPLPSSPAIILPAEKNKRLEPIPNAVEGEG